MDENKLTKILEETLDRRLGETETKLEKALDAKLEEKLDKKFEQHFIRLLNQGFEEVIAPTLESMEIEIKKEISSLRDPTNRVERKLDREVAKVGDHEKKVRQLEKNLNPQP